LERCASHNEVADMAAEEAVTPSPAAVPGLAGASVEVPGSAVV